MPTESQFVALDCEMVGIGPGGYESSLARVTVINWFGQVLLDAYVKQSQPVRDYRTFVSGITEQDLKDATLSLQECRAMVFQLLQNRILVGHALKNDLTVLGIAHPWWLLRDTAKYEPFMKVRCGHNDGVLWPRKLKDLVQEKLDQEIQVYGRPHSPYEDALGALNLYKSVQAHWEQAAHYKVEQTNQIYQQQQLIHQQQQRFHQQQQIRLLNQRRRQQKMSQQQPQLVQ
jgi:RNA exonuclease 4